jgi:hypothetical protein
MLAKPKTILRDLGNGLVLRRSTIEDAEPLAEFNGRIHGDDEQDGMRIAAWTRDLLTRTHPTFHPDDFTIVEETASGRIVSSMNLIPQTWSYEGIEFGVGRPELVGTAPEYRNRGLVRAQFEEIHRWSAERGHQVQVITGIPYYYRLFGYEMALDLAGRRVGYESHVPKLKDGEQEAYRIRPAGDADLALISGLYERAIQRHAVACIRTPEIFKYELDGQSENNADHYPMLMIEDLSGETLGYFQHPTYLGQTGLSVLWYELKPGVSWLAVTPAVVRYMWNQGQEYAKRDGRSCSSFAFMLGTEHPAYQALGRNLPDVRTPYAFYVRVPDLVAFLNHIKPALEKRIAGSIAAGHSLEIRISFYRQGLRLRIEKGRITAIEAWKPSPEEGGSIAFPERTFLQIVFGYRSYDELHQSFADCWCDSQEVQALINILFPKKPSDVFPVA